MQRIKTKFEGTYPGEQLSRFSSNSESEVIYPEGISTEKSVSFCSGSVELQMSENGIFFTPPKYSLVCCMPQVSWAVRHTHDYENSF